MMTADTNLTAEELSRTAVAALATTAQVLDWTANVLLLFKDRFDRLAPDHTKLQYLGGGPRRSPYLDFLNWSGYVAVPGKMKWTGKSDDPPASMSFFMVALESARNENMKPIQFIRGRCAGFKKKDRSNGTPADRIWELLDWVNAHRPSGAVQDRPQLPSSVVGKLSCEVVSLVDCLSAPAADQLVQDSVDYALKDLDGA